MVKVYGVFWSERYEGSGLLELFNKEEDAISYMKSKPTDESCTYYIEILEVY